MAPDNKVQEASQVALPYAVLGILGVRHSVLVQHKDVEPLCVRDLLAGSRSDPTSLHMIVAKFHRELLSVAAKAQGANALAIGVGVLL